MMCLKRGKLEIWASAVIYALGQINLLFDKDFEPYSTPDEICDYFKTKNLQFQIKPKLFVKCLIYNRLTKNSQLTI